MTPAHRTFFSLGVACCLVTASIASDQIPATQPAHPIVLADATIHTAVGRTIAQGSVLIVDGKIVGVGNVDTPPNAQVIDCTGKHLYPGFFDASNEIGLTEIDAVRATRDVSEAGPINPNARAQIAVNPDSELIPVTRSNGVLVAHVMPEGGLLSGTSAVMMLDGWTWEEMTLAPSAGMVLNWPNMTAARNYDNPEDEKRQIENRNRQLRELDRTFDDARAYAIARRAAIASEPSSSTSQASTQLSTQPVALFDARWEAMVPVLERSIPLIIRADEMGQIHAAVAFAKRQDVRCIIAGGRDADRCVDLLKAMDVPVLITGTHRLPGNPDDDIDAIYTLPAKLKAAGVQFAITSNGWASLVRNLPYQAASATAFGLSPEDAVRSITLWPAQILGVDSQIGSIEAGKEATLFVADGDMLEIPSNVEYAFIQGRPVDLGDRHKTLRDKYQKRIDATTRPAR